MTIDQINACKSQTQLGTLVEYYLKSIGEYESSRSESYLETAERLWDNLLRAAETKWFELENTNWGGSRPGAGRPPTGRKQVKFFLTDDEKAQVKQFIDAIRGGRNND